MKHDDFVEYVQRLQNKKFVTSRKPSTIIGNFYSLITIVIVSISILIYTNFIVPALESKKIETKIEIKK